MRVYTDTSGKFYYQTGGSGTRTEVSLPSGVSAKSPIARPKFARYKTPSNDLAVPLRNSYISGQFTSLLMWTFAQTLVKAGFTTPTAAPTLATGAANGLSGAVIASYSWAQYISGAYIAESNPSPKSAAVQFSNQKATVSGVPAVAPDARSTHWIPYLSVDGSVSFRGDPVPVGTTSTTVDMTNAELFQQETMALKLDDDGNEADDVLARGTPPYATIIGVWHDRMWYVDPTKPGLWYSYLFAPESVNEDTDRSFIPTPGGEFPLSFGFLDDELVIFCEDVFYSLAGFGEQSFRIRKVSEGVRFVCPWSPVTINGMIFFASDQGIMAYAGGGGNGFRNLMGQTFRSYWCELYAANTGAFENGCADNDMRFGDYVFAPDWSTTRTIRGYYRPMVEDGEREPWWFFGDVRNRRLKTLGQIYVPGTHRGLLAYGECDGFVRTDDELDGTDDGDTYKKRMRVTHPHFFMDDQGGDDAHGRTYTNLVWFGLQNLNTITVNIYGGDDTANQASVPTSTDTIEPLTDDQGQETQATSRAISLEEVSGKGATVEVIIDNPIQVEHRGFALLHRKGPQVRE